MRHENPDLYDRGAYEYDCLCNVMLDLPWATNSPQFNSSFIHFSKTVIRHDLAGIFGLQKATRHS
jgi:hypothetical protein